MLLHKMLGNSSNLAQFVSIDGFFGHPLLYPSAGFDFHKNELLVILKNEIYLAKVGAIILGYEAVTLTF